MKEMDKVTNLDACIKCSACSAQCPVAAVNPHFPGPKVLGPDAERFRLEGVKFDPNCLSYCSNCKTCEVTCPSGVKITEMILRAKGKDDGRSSLIKQNWRHHIRDGILGRAEYLGKLGTVWPGLTNGVLKIKPMRHLMEKTLGIGVKAPLPPYGKRLKPRRTGFNSHSKSTINGRTKQVIYFPGCLISYNDYLTGEAVVKVLEHNGVEVIIPDFKCCGVPVEANGLFKEANRNGLYNLSLIDDYLKAGIPVIASCTSCSLHLKEEYPKLDSPSAGRIGRQTYDLFEYLWELYERGELKTDFSEVQVSLGYHNPCHLKAQGIGTPSLRILRLIPGVKVIDIDSGCCGLSGSYGFKEEKYPLAMEIGRPLFERAKDGLAQGEFKEMITECGICRVQIQHGSGLNTYQPVWILMKAYNLS
ncbi:MAG: anaerobic glycerol-3-phosphate dehydrogenase subunit C [Desulfitobacterium hafniense]|nr:anaerobic glycerol-3-phosphate dehydrogenase subunit C [Desulfitobacterium hafniense]